MQSHAFAAGLSWKRGRGPDGGVVYGCTLVVEDLSDPAVATFDEGR